METTEATFFKKMQKYLMTQWLDDDAQNELAPKIIVSKIPKESRN
jgi:hypothetical protein